MSQSEVLELLKKQELPLSAREISIKLNSNYDKITKDINKMLHYKELDYVEVNGIIALEKYHCKRRLRLYYVKKKK